MIAALAIRLGKLEADRNVLGFGGDLFAQGAQLVIAVAGVHRIADLPVPDARLGRGGCGGLSRTARLMDAGHRDGGAGGQNALEWSRSFMRVSVSIDNSSPACVPDFSAVPAGSSRIECAVRQADSRQAGTACLTLRTFRFLSR